jgi:hypothetical protein
MPGCLAEFLPNLVAVVALNESGSDVWRGVTQEAVTNKKFTVGAPGEGIVGPWPNNQFGRMSGSSQSAAIVSGAASLATGAMGPMEPQRLRALLVACSEITNDNLLDRMVGGALDVSCLADGAVDKFIDRRNGEIVGEVADIVENTTGDKLAEITFYQSPGGTTGLNWSEIAGFRTDPTDDRKTVLFRMDRKGMMSHLRGTFRGEPLVVVETTNDNSEEFLMSDVQLYVRSAK